MRRLASLLVTLAFATFWWMTYDNVWSDVEPTKALAEVQACRVKDCKQRHGLTRLTRNPAGKTFEYTWESGVVTVGCRRESYAFGPMHCQVP